VTRHRQVRIDDGSISAHVDVQIAPLILALWRNSIATQASCQGDDERMASISFPMGVYADRFVRLVKPWRLAVKLHPDRHPQTTDWQWKASHGGSDDSVFVHVKFPHSELPAVTAAAEHPDGRSFGEWLDDEHHRQQHHDDARDAR
jgi:hypothetical protein